jgi:hypothetical protein
MGFRLVGNKEGTVCHSPAVAEPCAVPTVDARRAPRSVRPVPRSKSDGFTGCFVCIGPVVMGPSSTMSEDVEPGRRIEGL